MMNAERMQGFFFRFGNTASLVVITGGTVCPCMSVRDSAHPSYSAEWHAVTNPSATKCNGTGKIGTSSVSTSIKAVIQSMSTLTMSKDLKKWLSEIGEVSPEDMYFIGAVKVSDGTFLNIASYTDQYLNKIVFDSKNYAISNASPIMFMDETVAVVALLKRTN